MTKKTLKALKGSIVKWKKIVAGKGLDLLTYNCPLCKLFYSNKHCSACPVVDEVGAHWCEKTPHTAWVDHRYDFHPDKKTLRVFKGCPDCKRLAQAELDFLISLLPEVTK